jgi:type II secretory pathway predicted ATPase ExeA
MVNFIFFGLPELDQVLSLDEPLKQRVAVRIKLQSFSEENTKDYIRHRMAVASGSIDVFTESAIKLIYQYSNGSPRLINTICDNALLEGFLFKNTSIDDSIVKAVAVDLGLDS